MSRKVTAGEQEAIMLEDEMMQADAEANGCGEKFVTVPIDEIPVHPIPCVRDEHGAIKGQTVKQLLQKINEEMDELKQALFIRKYFLDMDEHVAEEAADVKTAITTLEEALGIDVAMRNEAQRKVNEKNRERGRL